MADGDRRRVRAAAASALLALGSAAGAGAARAQPPGIELVALDGRAIPVTEAELAALPRARVAMSIHGATHQFEGPRLADLLARAGAPLGPALRGADLVDVVVVQARDGYRVALSLGEVDGALHPGGAILADREDGAPLAAADGPHRLVVEGDLRPARAERQVARLRLVRPEAPAAPPTR